MFHAGQHCAELECTRNTETYRLLPLLAQRKVRADWIFEGILCHATLYDADVVESLLELAIEIAREGRIAKVLPKAQFASSLLNSSRYERLQRPHELFLLPTYFS